MERKIRNGKREYETFARLHMQLDCSVDEMAEAIETVVNLIQTQQEEIEKYKMMLAENCARTLNSNLKQKHKHKEDLELLHLGWKKELEKKDAQIQILMNRNKNLEKECQDYHDDMMDTIADNNNKNLIINAMAEQLTTPLHNKEWVIDYYTKKVEKENE